MRLTGIHQYAEQKGFCEDLDEGKYSLPLIHLVKTTRSEHLLRNLLSQRHLNSGSNVEHKRTVLELMNKSGSLSFTADFLDALHKKVEKSLGELETKFGAENPELRILLKMLKV